MSERVSESWSSSSRSGWYGRRRRGLALGKSRPGDVARGAGFKVAAPWGCGMEHRRRREVELRRRCDAMSVQPLWWSQVGLGFVRGVGGDATVPVEQVKAALWGWSSRDRRVDRWSSSLRVEDGAAKLARQQDGRWILIRGGGRGTSSCCGGRRRRGRGSGWAAVTWRTEEGGVSRLEQRGYGILGFRMAKRRSWEGVNHDLGTSLSKM